MSEVKIQEALRRLREALWLLGWETLFLMVSDGETVAMLKDPGIPTSSIREWMELIEKEGKLEEVVH